MAWDPRGYYYRAVRIGGKPTRRYVGGGLLGELAAAQDAKRAAQVAQQRQDRRRDHAELRQVDRQYRALRSVAHGVLTAAGYYQHHREWRRMDAKAFARRYREAAERDALAAAGKLAKRADLSGARAISGLALAEQMVASYCAGQPEAQAVIGHELRTLCRDLGMDNAAPFERELIAHVVECWTWLKLAQLTLNRVCSSEHTYTEGDYRERRVTEAQRRYLRALALLAKLRHLGPAVQINLAHQQVVMNGKD